MFYISDVGGGGSFWDSFRLLIAVIGVESAVKYSFVYTDIQMR